MPAVATFIGTLLYVWSLPKIRAQVMKADGCLLLSGTITCPPWNTAWVNPMELVNAGYLEFANVTDLATFDAAAVSYLGNLDEYRATKFGNDQLACTNATTAIIRYSRSILCSTWINAESSLKCFNLYSQVDRDIGPKYVCQDTCNKHAANEQSIVNDTRYCPTDLSGGNRYLTLLRDYASCTDRASSLTNNTNTCIDGDRNEGSCGFGGSTEQLCAHCNTSSPDSCCYQSNTDITPCGYALPVIPSSTTSATATATSAGVVAAHNGLNGGQIAGIVVGSVIGGLLLLGLLIGLLICCGVLGGRGKRRRSAQSESPFAQESKLDPFRGAQREDLTYVANPTPATSASSPAASPNITSISSGMPGALAAPIPLPTEPAAAAVAAGGRNVLSSMRDENHSGEHLILPNSVVTVLWPYTATLADELTLIPGMRLVVLRIYDDAWVTGQILDCVDDPTQNGKEGAFPLVCVTQADSSGTGGLPGLNKIESSEASPAATV